MSLKKGECTYFLENVVHIYVHAGSLSMGVFESLDVVVHAGMVRKMTVRLAGVQVLQPFEFAVNLVHALLRLHLIPGMKVVDSLSPPYSLVEQLAMVGLAQSDVNHSVMIHRIFRPLFVILVPLFLASSFMHKYELYGLYLDLTGMIELLTHLGLRLKVARSKTDIFNP